jgi:hypothetical protein
LRQCGIKLAHVRRHQGDGDDAAVALCEHAAQHRFEVVNVAIDRVLELGVALIMHPDRPAFASADQAHRATGEHAAIALEIGVPGLVVDFVGHDLANVDCRGVHRVDEQRDALGEGFAVLLALFLAGLLNVCLERRGGLSERDHLLGQAIRRGAGGLDRSFRHDLDVA